MPRKFAMLMVGIAFAACGTGEDHGAWREELFQGPPGRADAPYFRLEEVRIPERLRGIATAGPDGEVIRIACDTCHGLVPPAGAANDLHADHPRQPGSSFRPAVLVEVELSRRGPEPLQSQVGGPHVGLTFDHGPLDCAHCHDPSAPHLLRTADARTVPTTEALELCSQCHGLQWRDFKNGAHGGMRGHWDRAAGPRERNHCVDCHDPHEPAFPRYRPLPPPVDRFAPIPPHRAPQRHGADDGAGDGSANHGATSNGRATEDAAPAPAEDGS